MPLRKAARVGAIVAVLFVLGFAISELPVLRWTVAAAKALHGMGWAGPLVTLAGMYALTLLLLPIIPFIVACGWLYGLWGSALSIAASVGSAATSFAVARAL